MKRAASPEEFRRTLSERCIATGVCSSPPRWQWPGSEPEEKGRAQVSSATKTISGEINGVQTVSAEVVGSLKAIQKSVSVVTDSISSVASAVEQQSAATSEISATMKAASSAATRIDQGINGGLNRSSQHFDEGGCDGHSEATVGSMWKAAVAVTRSPPGGRAKRAAAVLEVHRDGH
jgi:hypothetical protein